MKIMDKKLKILFLEDNDYDAEIVRRVLAKGKLDYEWRHARDRKSFLYELDTFFPDIVLSDHSMPQFSSNEALEIVRTKLPHIPFIMVTGSVSEEFAANILTQGADDYILKDRMVRLPTAIEASLRKRRVEKEIADYKYALDQSADITITDRKGIIIYANENFCNLSQYSAGELVGNDHRMINSGYHPVSFFEELWSTVSQGKIWQGEVRNKAKDGSYYWVDTTIVPFLDEKGKPYQYLAIRRNISQRKKTEQELKDIHDRLFFHIENSPLAFIEWNDQVRPTAWSKRAEEIFGWTEMEVMSERFDWFSKIYEEDLPWVERISKQLVNGEVQRTNIRHRNVTKEGRVIWCEWFNSVLRDENGKMITLMSLVQDITERKKAEEDLLQSQLRLNQAQEIAHFGNWEFNFETNTSKWSDEAYRIYGLSPGDHNLSQADWMSFVHPDDLDYVKEITEKSEATLSDFSFDHRIVRKDGVVRHVYSEAKFEFNGEGKPIGLYGITHDITESKKAGEDLKKSNERFQYATRATSDIIWELNFETKQYLVHEGKEKLFGEKRVIDWQLGVEGKYILDEDRERVRQSFKEARLNPARTLWELEYRVSQEDGSVLYVINHAVFIRNNEGKAVRVIGAITNITERKKLELELLEQQRNEQLKLTATALEAQEKERTLLGRELHDNVNQILVGTKLLLSMAKNNPEKAKELVNTSIGHLQEAIEENRKLSHRLVTPDLEQENLVEQLTELVREMLATTGIQTHLNTSSLQEKYLSDQQKISIYRIAQEQCTNIIKYAGAKTVTISLETNDLFKMIISDDGRGMEQDKTTKGIGLRNITGRLSVFKGKMEIKTAPGKGFSLEIEMPLKASI